MTKGILKDLSLEKFLYQNAGEIADCVEGCLLDNLLVYARRGVLAIYEKPETPNSSVYSFVFCPYKDIAGCGKIESDFFKYREDVEEGL